MTMTERRGVEGDWVDDVTDVMTTPCKRITPEMQARRARARAAAESVAVESVAVESVAQEVEEVPVPFDLSDVRRR